MLIILSTFPVFVALAKLYLKPSEDPRFLNKRVKIKRVEKVNLYFLRPPLPLFVLWESFSATSISP